MYFIGQIRWIGTVPGRQRVHNYDKLYTVFAECDLLEYNTVTKPRVPEPTGMRVPVC